MTCMRRTSSSSPLERQATDDELEEGHAEAVDVAAQVRCGAALGLFG